MLDYIRDIFFGGLERRGITRHLQRLDERHPGSNHRAKLVIEFGPSAESSRGNDHSTQN
jgi:hypothetical protein